MNLVSRVSVVAALILTVAFAGCAGETAPIVPAVESSIDPKLIAGDGRDLRTQLQATDEIALPDWKIGDSFGHHVFFEGGPQDGLHLSTIVVEDQGASWLVATDDKQTAKLEAAYDLPILGSLSKKDLSSTGFGVEWRMYDFPLKNGKTWSRDVTTQDEQGNPQTVQVNYEVAFNGAIATPDGSRPGFDITGRTDGGVLFFYDFVPDIKWYAHFYEYNLATDAPDDYNFHVMSMGHDSGWTGTYYVDTSAPLMEVFGGMGIDPDAPTQPFLPTEPHDTFTVAAGATYIVGFAGAFAIAGVHEVLIIDPANNRHEYQAVGTPEGETFSDVDLPAVPGEWRVVKAGVGVASFHFIFLYAITETSKVLA